MKIKILTFILVLVLAGGAIIYDEATKPKTMQPDVHVVATDMTPTPAPSIKAVTFDGKEVSIPDLKEDVILLHFWAEWCSICYAEFPDLLKLVAESKGRIGLLAVSIDGKREDAQKLVNKLGKSKGVKVDDPHIYWIWDEGKQISLKTFNTISVPETIIISKKRLMFKKAVGMVNWHSDEIRAVLDAAVN